jgi:hypothetical protein
MNAKIHMCKYLGTFSPVTLTIKFDIHFSENNITTHTLSSSSLLQSDRIIDHSGLLTRTVAGESSVLRATAMASAEEHLALLDQILQDPGLTAEEKIGRANNLRRPRSHSTSKSQSKSPTQTNGAGPDLDSKQKLDLITSNLQECLNREIMEDVLFKENRPLRIYWGGQLSASGVARAN